MINKFFALLLAVMFILPKTLNAQEKEFDYEHLTAGSCLTSDGFFFTEQGMVALVVNTREKIRLATLDGQRQIDLLKVDLKTCSESKDSELRIQRQMFEKQLAIKQQAIDSYKSDAYWSNVKIIGGVVIGIGIGVLATTLFLR